MITAGEKTKLMKVLKNRYSKDVQSILKEKGVVTKKGATYGSSFITHVLNGRYENEAIESAFFELYKKKKEAVAKQKANRKEILENKKPEAGTSGLV